MDTIRDAEVRRTLAAAIEDLQLVFDEHGLGNDGSEASRPYQPNHGDEQMNEKAEDVAHAGNGISAQEPRLQSDLGIRHGQVRDVTYRRQTEPAVGFGIAVAVDAARS
jgi:hypothetical protein